MQLPAHPRQLLRRAGSAASAWTHQVEDLRAHQRPGRPGPLGPDVPDLHPVPARAADLLRGGHLAPRRPHLRQRQHQGPLRGRRPREAHRLTRTARRPHAPRSQPEAPDERDGVFPCRSSSPSISSSPKRSAPAARRTRTSRSTQEHGWFLSGKLFTDEEVDRLEAASERFYAGHRDRTLPVAPAEAGLLGAGRRPRPAAQRLHPLRGRPTKEWLWPPIQWQLFCTAAYGIRGLRCFVCAFTQLPPPYR